MADVILTEKDKALMRQSGMTQNQVDRYLEVLNRRVNKYINSKVDKMYGVGK